MTKTNEQIKGAIAPITVEGACKILGISKPTLYRYVDNKSLTAYKVGGILRFEMQDLKAYMISCRTSNRKGTV